MSSPYSLNIPSMGAGHGQVLKWNNTLSKWQPAGDEVGVPGPTLPSGTSGQTLRYDTAWIANSLLFNNGMNIGIGTTSPIRKLHVETNGFIVGYFKNTSTFDVGYGVFADAASADNEGTGGRFIGGRNGVEGTVTPLYSAYYSGVTGFVSGGSGINRGIVGNASNGNVNYGVLGYAGAGVTNYGIYGFHGVGTTNWAGWFQGNVNVTGSLSKGSGSFLIDHPLDPLNKTLRHNFVESPWNMCVYPGKATLDTSGEVLIEMPDYYIALVKEDEAVAQITPIGRPFPVGYELQGSMLRIYGDPGREISYIVMADRDDPVMRELYRPVEEEKGVDNGWTRGRLLYPAAYGYSEELGQDYEHNHKFLDNQEAVK